MSTIPRLASLSPQKYSSILLMYPGWSTPMLAWQSSATSALPYCPLSSAKNMCMKASELHHTLGKPVQLIIISNPTISICNIRGR